VREEERNDSRGACEGDGEEDGEELKADETSLEMQKRFGRVEETQENPLM
jgi:hypothetical protein